MRRRDGTEQKGHRRTEAPEAATRGGVASINSSNSLLARRKRRRGGLSRRSTPVDCWKGHAGGQWGLAQPYGLGRVMGSWQRLLVSATPHACQIGEEQLHILNNARCDGIGSDTRYINPIAVGKRAQKGATSTDDDWAGNGG